MSTNQSVEIRLAGGVFYRFTKRLLDLLGAVFLLVIASPLLLLAAILIRLESSGPIVYRQWRVGLEGREFEILKLRTMVDGAERIGAGLAVNDGDERITRVGRLLRRTSLDEFPNLINVIRGEMSLVGPRPTLKLQVEQYSARQRARLLVRPGITGWAQVNGRASLPWSERIELDLFYVQRRTLCLDLKILLRTFVTAFSSKDLYKGSSGGWNNPS